MMKALGPRAKIDSEKRLPNAKNLYMIQSTDMVQGSSPSTKSMRERKASKATRPQRANFRHTSAVTAEWRARVVIVVVPEQTAASVRVRLTKEATAGIVVVRAKA